MQGALTVPLSVMGRLEAEVLHDLINPVLKQGLEALGSSVPTSHHLPPYDSLTEVFHPQ